ncbi:MAG: amidase, hydantoinase/carbamoylase family [Glaciihabitans sp.]|nr:amidase, hydantoinase/carbamoylase family [Glaciihabitans sp.]
MSVVSLLAELADVGASRAGGYDRLAWTRADSKCREWFVAQSESRGLDVEVDRNGNLWAWLNPSLPGSALVVGSHLDSVPRGGAFDGPLGIASAFAALDLLADFAPTRPIAIVAFADEEGARFGVACAGSRLLTGALAADTFRSLTDADGVTTAEAMSNAGQSPDHVGADLERVARIGEFIELHVEQGHLRTSAGVDGLTPDAPLGLATEIWPHGRWRVDLVGQQNHAGTTRLADRVDPMLDLARVILEVRNAAEVGGILATVGKVRVSPGAVNAIPGSVSAWIDARGSDEDRVVSVMGDIGRGAVLESWTPTTPFDSAFFADVGKAIGGDLPLLPSGAGHDAGVLALAGIPTAMILVRNPSGISHAPEEFAEDGDCERGVVALAAAMRSRTV